MKPACILIISFLAVKGLSAQDARVEKIPPLRSGPFLKIDTGISKLTTGRLHKIDGIYSHRVPQGTVYLLRLDKMPCLVTDSTENARMPNAKHLVVPVGPAPRPKN